MWLDLQELDQLEDKVLDVDEVKGSMVFKSTSTDRLCPHCGGQLRRFQYRLHSLELEYCENDHGFWLDEGEEKRVLELMKEREKRLRRKVAAESEWKKTLRRLRSPSFFDKLKDLFR
jgi:Zn-finger nucleic acid-binding protein